MFLEIIVVVVFLVLLSGLVYTRSGEGPVVRKQARLTGSYISVRCVTDTINITISVPTRFRNLVTRLSQWTTGCPDGWVSRTEPQLWLQLPGAFVERR